MNMPYRLTKEQARCFAQAAEAVALLRGKLEMTFKNGADVYVVRRAVDGYVAISVIVPQLVDLQTERYQCLADFALIYGLK